jgi:hypothetical protein
LASEPQVEVRGGFDGAAEGVSCCRGGGRSEAGGDVVAESAAVDRCTEAAEQRDAQRGAELGCGL